jgi:hypothetical protein
MLSQLARTVTVTVAAQHDASTNDLDSERHQSSRPFHAASFT